MKGMAGGGKQKSAEVPDKKLQLSVGQVMVQAITPTHCYTLSFAVLVYVQVKYPAIWRSLSFYIFTCMLTHMHMHAYTHTHTHTHTHTLTYSHTHMCMHTHTHTHTNMCMHACTHTNTHTHTVHAQPTVHSHAVIPKQAYMHGNAYIIQTHTKYNHYSSYPTVTTHCLPQKHTLANLNLQFQ